MSLQAALPLPVLPQTHQPMMRPATQLPLRDPLNRGIGYLRLSLTSACSMRCTYCRPATYDNPSNELRLSPDEIESVVRHLADRHGLSKVRLTGGDPTSRPELVKIIERIASVPGIEDLAMTTNGLSLGRMASRYRDAGLSRVNISLDTLNAKRFEELTGVNGLGRVLKGINAAQQAGLTPIKINTVVVRGQNDRDLVDLVRFAAGKDLEIRFIELMPMGPLAGDWEERYMPEADIRNRLSVAMRFDAPMPQGHDAARRYRVTLDDGRRVSVGFITPMSCNFCADCNRIRLAADGRIYPCLMDKPAGSLLDAVRPHVDADQIDARLADALSQKQPEHPAYGTAIMTTLGG